MSDGDRDPTLKGVGRRLDNVEDTIAIMQASLSKLVTLTQRIQWTFTGLAIYYIIDSGDTGKLLLKAMIL
jgi:hypothetical protein